MTLIRVSSTSGLHAPKSNFTQRPGTPHVPVYGFRSPCLLRHKASKHVSPRAANNDVLDIVVNELRQFHAEAGPRKDGVGASACMCVRMQGCGVAASRVI